MYILILRQEDGTASQSFVVDALERARDSEDFEFQAHLVKQTAMQVFGGESRRQLSEQCPNSSIVAFSESTVTSVMTFILAMLIHPEVQLRAQEEIDSIVGVDRLPDFSDIPRLPYLSAIVKETLR
jgi:hypothetical protein